MTRTLGVGILALTLIISTLGGALLINQTKPQVAKAASTAVNLDPTFTGGGSGFDSNIVGSVTKSDGKSIVVGAFNAFNTTPLKKIARLNTNGTLDTAYLTANGTGFNNGITSIIIQADDKIVVTGYFTTFNGTATNKIARLNTDGTLDTAFTSNYNTYFTSFIRHKSSDGRG